MALALQNKLRLNPGMKLLTIDAPVGFDETIGAVSNKFITGNKLKDYDQVHWFVKTRKEFDAGMPRLKKLLHKDVICWIYYPKATSKLQTDLTRDKGWELLHKEPGLKWLSLISFDNTWSTFAIRLESDADKIQKQKKVPRVILDYIDPVKKTIVIPDDLKTAFEKHQDIAAYFSQLAFSHRKEYVEWIVTAKRDETRKKRVEGTIERLQQKWKNPRNL